MPDTASGQAMSGRDGARPRSVALVGPYGSGKSVLFDALLAAAGVPSRRPGEARGHTPNTDLRIGQCQFMGDAWSLLDCPGSVEFTHEAHAAVAVADLAVVVCEPLPEKARMAAPLLRLLHAGDVPHMVLINKIDSFTGRVEDTLAALQAVSPLVLRQMPIRDNETIIGYADLASGRAYRYRKGAASELLDIKAAELAGEPEALFTLLEALADHDDALLEKLLQDVTPSSGEIYRDLHRDLADGALVPVLLAAGERDNGVRRLWKALRHDTPDPLETAARHRIAPDGEALAQVFKTVHAGHTGKLSYARVWRGTIKDGATLNGQRVGGIYHVSNGDLAKAGEAGAGDVVAFGRLDAAPTGATLSPSGHAGKLPWIAAPPPVYALAIFTDDHKDDVKLSGALQKLADEDAGLTVVQDAESSETVLRGQGEMHLHAALDRLTRLSGLKIGTRRPSVAYRETIRHAVQQHARLKRQTGGHGQFADVKLDIAPRGRGEGFLFRDRIVGGAVPKQYIPAVGEAAEAALHKGPFGHPVVDVEVVLVDGTFHAVDSSDMAFKSATRQAMQEGLAKGDPVVLEPIEHVTISVPNDFTASAQRLLSGRRGRILGYAERAGWPGWDDVEAQVPAAELHDLIIELRSMTLGLGTYRHEFDHLAEAKGHVLEKAGA